MVRGAGITEWRLVRGRLLLRTSRSAGRWGHVWPIVYGCCRFFCGAIRPSLTMNDAGGLRKMCHRKGPSGLRYKRRRTVSFSLSFFVRGRPPVQCSAPPPAHPQKSGDVTRTHRSVAVICRYREQTRWGFGSGGAPLNIWGPPHCPSPSVCARGRRAVMGGVEANRRPLGGHPTAVQGPHAPAEGAVGRGNSETRGLCATRGTPAQISGRLRRFGGGWGIPGHLMRRGGGYTLCPPPPLPRGGPFSQSQVSKPLKPRPPCSQPPPRTSAKQPSKVRPPSADGEVGVHVGAVGAPTHDNASPRGQRGAAVPPNPWARGGGLLVPAAPFCPHPFPRHLPPHLPDSGRHRLWLPSVLPERGTVARRHGGTCS